MKYSIARHIVNLELRNTSLSSGALRAFRNFEIADDGCDASIAECGFEKSLSTQLTVIVDDGVRPYAKDELRLLRDVDTGNGVISVFRRTVGGEDVGFQFIIRDIRGYACALLKAGNTFSECQCALRGDDIMRSYGLNSVLMLSYAFATAPYLTLLIHASMVQHQGKAYAFFAKSGTGKSTQVSNWLRNISDCQLMNDDNPILRIEGDRVVAYGSPWSGKTPCYRNISAPLGGIAKIVRDTTNHIERFPNLTAFTELLASCSVMKWDTSLYKHVTQSVSEIVRLARVYELHCLPDADSARVASDGMKGENTPDGMKGDGV